MIPGVECQTPTWRALKRHIKARISDLQQHLEAPSDIEVTATIRGQIKELRALIERVDPPVSDEPETTTSEASLY